MSHPNVCQLYEVGEYADTFFLSMELLRGESLADRIRRAPLGSDESTRIQATDRGYLCSAAFERDPWLQSLKPLPACTALMQRIVAAEQDVARAFVQAGGTRVLDDSPA